MQTDFENEQLQTKSLTRQQTNLEKELHQKDLDMKNGNQQSMETYQKELQ